MKLYTKEMFLIAAEKCEVSMIDAKHIMKYIDEYVKPIELPTDEEIEKYVKSTGYYGHCTPEYHEGIEEGAKWVIEQINNLNK